MKIAHILLFFISTLFATLDTVAQDDLEKTKDTLINKSKYGLRFGLDLSMPLRSILDDGYQGVCLLYTSPSPRDRTRSRMPSSA